jgi:LDH2 family malate/lactate/ureidoglycolate dehydrogenase
MRIKLEHLRELTKKALLNYGYNQAETAAISEVLLYAQLRGNNQGVVKLIGKGIPKSPDVKPVEIEKETKLSVLINAHQNHAMVVLNQAADLAIKKAKEHGMSIVGVNNINTSSGALGFYARKIAKANLIGFVFAGSMETVATHGSSEALFGTNPFAIGVPAEGEPLVYDIATAAMAYFGVVEANTAGRKLPDGIAFDKSGNPTANPADVLDGGSLRTFDKGHKGTGLSMMVQILTGPLTGSYYTGFGDVAKNWGGHFIFAFDPELLDGVEAVRRGVAQITQKAKSTKKLPGVSEIFVPGEKGNRLTQKFLASGEIEIEENLYNELKKAAK